MTHKLVSPKTSAKHLHGSSSECSVQFKSGAFLVPQHFPPGARRALSLIHSPLRVFVRGLHRSLLSDLLRTSGSCSLLVFTETVNVFLPKTIARREAKKCPPNLLRDLPRSRHGDKRNRKPQLERGRVHIHIYIYLYIGMHITEGSFSLSAFYQPM